MNNNIKHLLHKKLHIIIPLIIFSLIVGVAPLSYSDTVKAPTIPIQHWMLSNGVNVYFVSSTQLPMVDITVMINAGSNRDQTQPGVANMTMSMIGEGTSTMDTDTIAERFDNVGALFSSDIQRDYSTFSLRSLSDKSYLKPAIHTFSAILLDPELSPKSFLRIKKQTIQNIRSQQQSPSSMATKIFYEQLYKNTPYGHDPLGNVPIINGLQFSDLLTFYNRFYVGKNTTLIIVGDLSKKRAQQLANNLLGQLPAGDKAPTLPTVQRIEKSKITQAQFPSTQTTIRMGQLGITPQDPDYYALQVGNYIFGGGLLVSRLFNEVREKRGLSYSIGSRFNMLKEKGPFVIGLQTRNNKAKEAVNVVKQTLETFLADGPSDEEVLAAKRHLISAFPLRLKSNSDIINNVAYLSFYDLPLDFLNTYQEKINGIDKAAIINAFQRHISPSQFITIMVGPSPSPLPPAKARG
ncbi:MAG: M16 family metallopeptidase [Gammaproteobacteria bacterium]